MYFLKDFEFSSSGDFYFTVVPSDQISPESRTNGAIKVPHCPTSFTLPLPALVYNRNFFVTNAKKLKKVRIFGWNNY